MSSDFESSHLSDYGLRQDNMDQFDWQIDSDTHSSGTGPSKDHTSGSGKYAIRPRLAPVHYQII